MFCFLFSVSAYAGKQSFLAKKVESINLKGLNIQASFVAKNSSNIVVDIKGGSVSANLKDGLLKIYDPKYKSKGNWESFQKVVTVTVVGPSREVNLFASEVQVKFSNWKKDTFLSARKAKVIDKARRGSLNLFIREGEFTSTKHKKGKLQINGFSVKASINEFSDLESVLRFNEGQLKITKGSGSIFFTVDKAPVYIRNFEGNLTGSTQFSSVNATVKVKNKINISSQKGDLRFYLKGVAAKLTAYTENGKIYAPNYMYKQYSGKSVKVTGRMKGSKKQGHVSLTTDTGTIQVY